MKCQASGRTILFTAERKEGGGQREAMYRMNLEQALARVGKRLVDMGLCEIGVATFVDRNAGRYVDASGKRVDKCSRWKERSKLITAMDAAWRTLRDKKLDRVAAHATELEEVLRAGMPDVVMHEIGPFEACPCGSGRFYGECHYRPEKR